MSPWISPAALLAREAEGKSLLMGGMNIPHPHFSIVAAQIAGRFLGLKEVISFTVPMWKIAYGDSSSLQLPAPRADSHAGWVQPDLLLTYFVTSSSCSSQAQQLKCASQ